MGGLGFIHGGFLLAALAVAVPIAIHLLFRQRARTVEIGTLHFLRVVLRDQAHRRRVRRWFLLAARCAAVLLLALLFARPYWSTPGAAGREREVALVIDRSASMAAGEPGHSPFDKAQAEADRLLRRQPDGTVAHLAYADADGVAPAKEAQVDPSIRPGSAAGDHGRALAWGRDLMVKSPRSFRQVYYFTDFQRTGLRSARPAAFPAGVGVELVDVGRPWARDLAVDDARASGTDLRPGEPVRISARVRNAGPFAVRGATVRLVLDGPERVEWQQVVDVNPGVRQPVRFEVPLTKPGLYTGSVEVAGGDELPADDRRFLAFEARAADRVLLVDGEPGPTVFGNETYYLEAALGLRVPGEAARPAATPFEPERLDWGRRGAALPALGPYRVVALCNVAEVPPAAADALGRFVAEGGGLILFGGDRVTAEGLGPLRRAGVLPATFEPSEPGTYRLASWETDHPLLRPFADPQHGDLRTLTFRRVDWLRPDGGTKVLALGPGGRPLIVEASHGRGKVLALGVAADAEWGDWPTGRLYLPLVHQAAGYLAGRLDGTDRVQLAAADAAHPPGLERAAANGGAVVVRNLDPGESEPDRATLASFRRALNLPDAARAAAPDGRDEPPPPPDGSQRPDEAWRWVAWALLAVLVGETFLANRTFA